MTGIDEARKRLALRAHHPEGCSECDEIRTVLDALDAAERERDEALREMHARELRHFEEEQRSAGLAAVIEEVKEQIEHTMHPGEVESRCGVCRIERILSAVPADVLRERDAEKWDEGAKAMMRAVSEEQTVSFIAPSSPYRETKEQD